jgi:diguanylate cyclase (GGDEF)-like protein
MAFWSKRTEANRAVTNREGSTREPDERGVGDLSEVALDAVAGLLRAIGRNAFPLDGTTPEAIARRFEGWARHVLVRSRPPGPELVESEGEDESARESAPKGTAERDFPGMLRFVAEHRKREGAHVAETVSGLRETVRSFMRAATRLKQISGVADGSTKGAIDRLRTAVERASPVDLRREVMSVASELETLVAQRQKSELEVTELLAEKVRELTSQLEEARREGATDPLTRLPNRRTLDAVLDELLELCQVTAQPVALAVIDVDHFKAVNDTHGHIAGDTLLRHIADHLSRTFMRRYDVVARYGGDEFCVLLRDTTAAEAKRLLARAAAAIAAPANGVKVAATLSIGVVDMVLGDTPASLLERADKALYRAKEAGRNTIVAGS